MASPPKKTTEVEPLTAPARLRGGEKLKAEAIERTKQMHVLDAFARILIAVVPAYLFLLGGLGSAYVLAAYIVTACLLLLCKGWGTTVLWSRFTTWKRQRTDSSP